MIKISQDEYFYLRNKIDNLTVRICSKRKKGANSKTYYCEERPIVLKAIAAYRNNLIKKEATS